MTDGQLPHDDGVEGALVARLLVDPGQLPVISGRLEAADFYDPAWRRLYAGMQLLSRERRTVDIVSLSTVAGTEATELLSGRVSEITSAWRAPLEEYADMIRGYAFRRRMIGNLEGVIFRAYSEDNRESLLSSLHEAVQGISAGIGEGHLVTPSQAVDSWEERHAERQAGRRRGLSWPLPSLDAALLPAAGGDMIVIAARPSVGKTALGETIADFWARQAPYPVLFASLEMSTAALLDRQVSRYSGLPSSQIIRGRLSPDEAITARETAQGLRDVGVWYLDDPFATTASIRAAAAKVRLLAGGLSAIVVDYLQIVKDAGDQEVQRVTRISRQIKAIAREMDVPLLALSQLSRASTQRDDHHPRLSDLRESGAIEQDADIVLGLYRELTESVLDVDVLKARQGEAGARIQLYFDKEHIRFLDLEEEAAWRAARALAGSQAATASVLDDLP